MEGTFYLYFTLLISSKILPAKTIAKFDELKAFMDTNGNFKMLRTAIHTANPPVIPYLGIYLSDLTFIEDGNPDEVDGLQILVDLSLILFRINQL
jgi:hypothetical protein